MLRFRVRHACVAGALLAPGSHCLASGLATVRVAPAAALSATSFHDCECPLASCHTPREAAFASSLSGQRRHLFTSSTAHLVQRKGSPKRAASAGGGAPSSASQATAAAAPTRRRKRTSASAIAAAAAAAAEETTAASSPARMRASAPKAAAASGSDTVAPSAAAAAATAGTSPTTRAQRAKQLQKQKQREQFKQFQQWQREQEKKKQLQQQQQQQQQPLQGRASASATASSALRHRRRLRETGEEGGAEAHAVGVDEVGAADAQDSVPATSYEMDVDEAPELAPTTEFNHEADEVELAAEVTEVTDFATEAAATPAAADALEDEGLHAADAEVGRDAGGTAGDAVGGTDASAAVTAAAAAAASSESTAASAPAVGSLLDFESPLNLRLATLTRNSGKAFRAVAVHMPLDRTSINFAITFEDIASGARLVCKLDEVKTLYMEWITQFRAAFVALFVPTLQHPNATLLQNAIMSAKPPRALPPPGSYHPSVNEESDHLFFSYTKLREVISKKRRDTVLNTQLLTVAVLNAYAEEWKNFITAPLSCAPQNYLQAAFNFHANQNAILNKELLHAQLAAAAEALVNSSSHKGGVTVHHRSTSRPENWNLIFVSAPPRSSVGVGAIPPMQDLLTGQFVEPLSLSERFVVYVIGSGNAAASFAQFPVSRKGSVAFSILLQDMEAQLGLQRSNRSPLTAVLAESLDRFSRMTWMSLMKEETGELRVPHPANAFYRLQRRSVQKEIVPGFLEAVFAPSNRVTGIGGVGGHHSGGGSMASQHRRVGAGGSGGGGGGAGAGGGAVENKTKDSRHVEEHMRLIFNNPDRLEREQGLRDQMHARKAVFVHIATASVTAARRADNPFSRRNGLVDVSAQLWGSLTLPNPPPIIHLEAKVDASGATREFVHPDKVIPDSLPTKPHDHPNPSERAENGVLVAWDAKRVLLFLRESRKLREFLLNGGKVWCAQYAQYIVKGFNHLNLATMERTLLQYHDGPLKSAMHPLAKLKLIYETQLDVAVNTRQLNSILHRMDGLLASTEMEVNGLQLAPQNEVSRFANTLRLDRERLEKVLQEKILDFTRGMDDDVRQRINFRSPQDISTIIYGGGLCRHLGSRFVPVRPTKYPITALFPHAVCSATGTPIPQPYVTAESLLGTFQNSAASSGVSAFTPSDVERTLRHLNAVCKRATLDDLVQSTAVVVLTVKAKMGGLLEQISLYVPSTTGEGQDREISIRVAIDDILPVSDTPNVVTVGQLKAMILTYPPLLRLREQLDAVAERNRTRKHHATTGSGGGHADGGSGSSRRRGRKAAAAQAQDDVGPPDLRNLLLVTNCSHDRLEPIVDTGVVAAIQRVVLGDGADGGDAAGSRAAAERPPFERVCFADLAKAFPAGPQGSDSFESDFSELSTSNKTAFSAKANWDSQTKDIIGVGGVEGVVRSMISHCASLLGTPRDAFRNPQPVPSAAPQGLHGQEQASTPGMLWMVTPNNLHPVLRRFLRGRSASSGADAMERVTVFLSPYKDIDLSFFTALQQLRYTEKKLQLFEEGALFRAVLAECNDRVHGELCHCVTATGRLSSQSPNLQNIPREEDLRTLIRSRFGAEGRMIEADYSQLEVVVLAALSRDPRMMQELRDQVDFHCLRVSLMTKEPYEHVVRKAKVEKDPQYIQLRQQAKVFSFQRQYGAGVATIATTTGLTEQEVDRLIVAEEQHYKELSRYYRLVLDCVGAGSDRLLRLRTLDTAMWNANMRRVVMLTEPLYYFVVATGSKFDFSKDRKTLPRLKNYPVQGLAGEIVQIICGKIIRRFYERRNYDGKAFLVNTVHDCVWVDAHESVEEQVKQDLKELMGNTQQIIGDLWPEMGLDVPFKAEIHSGTTLGEMAS